MKLSLSKMFFLALTIVLCGVSHSYAEYEENYNSTKRYDEIIDKGTFEKTVRIPTDIEPMEDEIALLLPEIDEVLYSGWVKQGISQIWKSGEANVFLPVTGENLLQDLGVVKALRQTYSHSDNAVSVAIYELNDFNSAYSLYTVKHRGKPSAIKIGRNVSESEGGLSFWKSKYFVDVSYADSTDKSAKLFSVLAGQEISRNIKDDVLPPDLAIKIPSLNRIDGSEKYCKSKSCYTAHFPAEVLAVAIDKLNIANTEGIITAQYLSQTSEKAKNKEKPTNFNLILTSYKTDLDADNVFKSYLLEYKAKSEKNEVKLTLTGNQLTVQGADNKYILLKKSGHLLAILCSVQDIEPAQKLLGLIPWPVDITFFNPLIKPELIKPITVDENESNLREPLSLNE